ncbi:hypothetical protein Q8A67_025044 [Cirrhinus molitorella]|uniref:Uncharacterized protein n=1 Tax=Cirrhinus molitorella TaxID=172907 RepID=A0AA88NTY6_9TELE|nr:hypothetical protein Q8A67_025044 [Cirrhinus molitorella]
MLTANGSRLYFQRVAPAATPGAQCGFSAGGTQNRRRLTSEHVEVSRQKEYKNQKESRWTSEMFTTWLLYPLL